jgi:hypothetical protein
VTCSSRLPDEDEAGPQNGVFAKGYWAGGARHLHGAGAELLQQHQLCAAERLRLVRNAPKRSVKTRHRQRPWIGEQKIPAIERTRRDLVLLGEPRHHTGRRIMDGVTLNQILAVRILQRREGEQEQRGP